jgi:hypothetical protein
VFDSAHLPIFRGESVCSRVDRLTIVIETHHSQPNFMTTSPSSSSLSGEIELAPSYRIPIVIVLGAIPLGILSPWVGLPVALFGVFLLVQTVAIRLKFTPTALDVYRSGKLLRTFPYAEWENWVIFWPPVPILFYFKEVNSIHFLPIIFDPKMLSACLEDRIPLTASAKSTVE